ncbi:hypothetical protein GCM10010831_17080 [Psychroflexus salis]|uniref:Uncharacterized protein n=1 Tax=Psychroflexus salis TaxID=1526574 RepID=A0A917E912_9FLAO|nr:hypothetical protein GCM10010831_17080 [Psychroflexus salis]
MAISGEFFKAACTLTKSSGADVANETTVKPITILEIFNLKDKPTDDLTKNSPPTTNNKRPININSMFINYSNSISEYSRIIVFIRS